jgi:hypothetical protein
MKKVLTKLGLEPWDYEIALKVDQGMDHHDAKSFVVMRWMKRAGLGNLNRAISGVSA